MAQIRNTRQFSNRRGIILSQIFSREKPLFYFCLWNESDRKGWKYFLNYQIQANLFIFPGLNQRTSVWYDQDELECLQSIVGQKFEKDGIRFAQKLFQQLDTYWPKVIPYLSGKKNIQTIGEFSQYYTHLVEWWSAMNTTFFSIPDIKEIPLNVRKKFLSHRKKAEPHAEAMSKVMTNFWTSVYPTYKDFAYILTPQEAIQIAQRGLSTSKKKVLQKRLKGYGMLNGKVFAKDELSRQLAAQHIVLNETTSGEQKTFKGSVAFPGKARGRVRLIMTHKELKVFGKGDILVTPMTTPDYVPFMKKAGAIVTDEGGITCHAAIVSRELGKPCIIGTKIATKVLKDGDLVEVDAERGVVRILNT